VRRDAAVYDEDGNWKGKPLDLEWEEKDFKYTL